ncbi:MAG: nitroreductase family protein [Paracoccaceae bacterium]
MPDDAPVAAAPLAARPEALAFLLARRSRPAKTLTGPGPARAELETMLTAAARTPDHGKLEPWRFIVLGEAACARLAALTHEIGAERGREPERLLKEAIGFRRAPVAVAVVASPVASDKIPEAEQTLSAGAVCLGLVNAALAMGWGANWLSGWMATDAAFLERGLGLAPQEWVAGFVHIGRETTPPPERPRPDLARRVEWVEA